MSEGRTTEMMPEAMMTAATPPDAADASPAATDADAQPVAPPDGGDRSLLALIDRLADLLQRSDLTELEVEAGRTGLVLRKPAALAPIAPAPGAGATAGGGATAPGGSTPDGYSSGPGSGRGSGRPGSGSSLAAGSYAPAATPTVGAEGAGRARESSAPAVAPAVPRASVKAPLTGIFYGSPSPGAAPYVRVGGEVAVGQVIGLIEAMKLFNEIKSDLAGRVVRIVAEDGTLVKAKQPLIEVEPL